MSSTNLNEGIQLQENQPIVWTTVGVPEDARESSFAALFQQASSMRGNAEVQAHRAYCAQNFMNFTQQEKQHFLQLLLQSGFTYPWNADQVDGVVQYNEAQAAANGAPGSNPVNRMKSGAPSWKILMNKMWNGVPRTFQTLGNFYAANLEFCIELGMYFYASGGVAFNGMIAHSRFWFRCMEWIYVQAVMDLQVQGAIVLLNYLAELLGNKPVDMPRVNNPYKELTTTIFNVIPFKKTDVEITRENVKKYFNGDNNAMRFEDWIIVANVNKPSHYLTNATVAKAGKTIPIDMVLTVEMRMNQIMEFMNKVVVMNPPLSVEHSFDNKAGFNAAYRTMTSYGQFLIAGMRAKFNGGGQLVRNEARGFEKRGQGSMYQNPRRRSEVQPNIQSRMNTTTVNPPAVNPVISRPTTNLANLNMAAATTSAPMGARPPPTYDELAAIVSNYQSSLSSGQLQPQYVHQNNSPPKPGALSTFNAQTNPAIPSGSMPSRYTGFGAGGVSNFV